MLVSIVLPSNATRQVTSIRRVRVVVGGYGINKVKVVVLLFLNKRRLVIGLMEYMIS